MSKRAIAVSLLFGAALVVTGDQSRVRNDDEYEQVADDSRSLRELDARVDRSVLAVESGLVPDYDPLTASLRDMRFQLARIEQTQIAQTDPAIAALVKKLHAHVLEEEARVSAFEAEFTVFRSALSSLPIAGRAAVADTIECPLDDEVDSEIAALLSQALCRSECPPAVLAEFAQTVAALEATRERLPPDLRASVDLTLHHARLFLEYSPRVDSAVDQVLASDDSSYDLLYGAVQTARIHAEARAAAFRWTFVALVAALCAWVAFAIVRLRLKAARLGLEVEKESAAKRRGEERLVETAEQYKVLLETSNAIPWEMKPDSLSFAFVGPQAEGILGYTLSEWLEPTFLEDRLAQSTPGGEVVERVLASREHDEVELALLSTTGKTVWFRCHLTTSIDTNGMKVRRGLLFDVTERRSLEANLRAAQKLEGIGRLASGIAHEINTPVQFVSDNVTFLLEAFIAFRTLVVAYKESLPASDERVKQAEDVADLDYLLQNVPEALESSREGVDRIATIVRSMKEFSHPDRKEKVTVDLNANIQSTLVIARNEYKEVAEVRTDFGALGPVPCHPGEINQVVLNLVVNAAHAIGDVVAGTGKLGSIVVSTRREDGDIVVRITDTGGGIPLENRDRLFEPFFTTKDVGRGTGQGLAIARSIVVDKHGGALSFETETGVGTTFTIRLPVVDVKATPRAA